MASQYIGVLSGKKLSRLAELRYVIVYGKSQSRAEICLKKNLKDGIIFLFI